MTVELILGDSHEWLAEQQPFSLFIVTDPPIGQFTRELHDAAHTYIMMGGQTLLATNRRIPGEKDMRHYLDLIDAFPYETVVDPFMGTGTIGEAAIARGKNFIGIERDPETFAIAEQRLKEWRK